MTCRISISNIFRKKILKGFLENVWCFEEVLWFLCMFFCEKLLRVLASERAIHSTNHREILAKFNNKKLLLTFLQNLSKCICVWRRKVVNMISTSLGSCAIFSYLIFICEINIIYEIIFFKNENLGKY